MYQENNFDTMQNSDTFTPQSTPDMHESPRGIRPKVKPIIPSKYSGNRNIAIIDSWISSVNAYFFLSNAQPPYIYYSLVTLLEGEAGVWFRFNYPESIAATLTWETVRHALRLYFTPVNYIRQLQDRYTTLRQSTSVNDYTMQFSEIVMQLAANHILIPDSMLIHQYIHGLKPATRLQVEIENPSSLPEAMRIAGTYDTIRFAKKTMASRYETTSRSPFYPSRYDDNRGEPMQLDNLELENSEDSNLEINAMKPKFSANKKLNKLTIEERQHLRRLGACFKCRQPGHMVRECPTNMESAVTSNNSKNIGRQ